MLLSAVGEGAWLSALPADAQRRFLARLSFNLTIAGRACYEAGTDAVSHPQELRRINEIQHRLAALLCQLLSGPAQQGQVASIARSVLMLDNPVLAGHLGHAWSEAKQFPAGALSE